MRSRINLDAAQAVNRGQNIKVAVIDTGIDAQHPLFAGKLLPGFDFVDRDMDPSEVGTPHLGAYGHGTHVAGIIAMVAPEAKIIPIRILDQDGVGDIWRLANALIYAANPDGDNSTDDGADIINLSLGTTQQAPLIRKILDAVTNTGSTPDDPDLPMLVNSSFPFPVEQICITRFTRRIERLGALMPSETCGQFIQSFTGHGMVILAPAGFMKKYGIDHVCTDIEVSMSIPY